MRHGMKWIWSKNITCEYGLRCSVHCIVLKLLLHHYMTGGKVNGENKEFGPKINRVGVDCSCWLFHVNSFLLKVKIVGNCSCHNSTLYIPYQMSSNIYFHSWQNVYKINCKATLYDSVTKQRMRDQRVHCRQAPWNADDSTYGIPTTMCCEGLLQNKSSTSPQLWLDS